MKVAEQRTLIVSARSAGSGGQEGDGAGNAEPKRSNHAKKDTRAASEFPVSVDKG